LQDEVASDVLNSSVNRKYDGSALKREIINQGIIGNVTNEEWFYGYTAFNRVLPNGILYDSDAVITYP